MICSSVTLSIADASLPPGMFPKGTAKAEEPPPHLIQTLLFACSIHPLVAYPSHTCTLLTLCEKFYFTRIEKHVEFNSGGMWW